VIPEPLESDVLIDLDAEYQLADRDSMRRAIIRRCHAAERIKSNLRDNFTIKLLTASQFEVTRFPGTVYEVPEGTVIYVNSEGHLHVDGSGGGMKCRHTRVRQ
jgi:hypothetical protein